MTLFGKLIHAAPLAGALLLAACGGGGVGGVTSAMTAGGNGGGQSIAVGEPNGKALDAGVYAAAVKDAACATIRSDLYVIDNTNVLWDRAGNCADNAYGYTLFGKTPDEVLCTQGDSIAGPRTECKTAADRLYFEGLLKNLDKADLGLGSTHKVEKTRLVAGPVGGFEVLLLDSYSGVAKPQNVIVKDDASLKQLLDQHYNGRTPAVLPKVDFSRKMVVGVFLGQQPQGCRAVSIVKVTAEGRQLQVAYEVHDLMTLQACTGYSSPAALAIVDRTDGAVEFVNNTAEQVAFDVLDKNAHSGIAKAQNVVIRDEDTFSALWAIHAPGVALPKVDFSKTMVIGAFLGTQPSSCQSVSINNVERTGKTLNVNLVLTQPGPTVLCAAIVTAPSFLVQVPRSDDPVTFQTMTVTL